MVTDCHRIAPGRVQSPRGGPSSASGRCGPSRSAAISPAAVCCPHRPGAGGAAVPLLYSYVERAAVRCPHRGGGALSPSGRRGVEHSGRGGVWRGVWAAGGAVLSYIAMYGGRCGMGRRPQWGGRCAPHRAGRPHRRGGILSSVHPGGGEVCAVAGAISPAAVCCPHRPGAGVISPGRAVVRIGAARCCPDRRRSPRRRAASPRHGKAAHGKRATKKR